MSTVLLVKTSSLGDVIHNLPVVSDIRRHFGEVTIDWVVEKAFAAIPALHPGVRTVIPLELRRWRRNWLSASTRAEWRAFVRQLRSRTYEVVIDTQGLLKSAIVVRCARSSDRVGLDWHSSREPLRPFYHRTFRVPWQLHAVERNRRLAGMCLGYEPESDPDYGIRSNPSSASWLPVSPYAVLLHATSHPRKLWPEDAWIGLGQWLSARGCSLVLPWGSQHELARAERLAQRLEAAVVPPAMDLAEVAQVLTGASAAVGVDTGLTHLAAALGVPTIGIFGATDPRATGLCTTGPAVNLGGFGRFPSVANVTAALQQVCIQHACTSDQ